MTHSNTSAAPLLIENLSLFKLTHRPLKVLDLACGNGRNGLVLAELGHAVTFADRDEEKLAEVERADRYSAQRCNRWLVDLEIAGSQPLAGRQFDAILVFNYLHRPLLPVIKDAVAPGGLLVYETFTTAQRAFGRPSNPDFLLERGELKALCADWQTLHYFEGELSAPARAVASVIARRP
jgi:SAM-dependent methyltransferase